MTRLTRRSVLVAGAATTASMVARPSILRAAEPLDVGAVMANAIHWVQFVATDRGFYKAEGFEPRVLQIQGSAQSVQAALAGQYQVATSQPETFISAVYQGATELGAMSAPSNSCDWILVGAKDIHSLQDLKGKEVGLSGLRASEQWLTGQLLEKHGMKPSDVKYVVAGTSAAKAAAVAKGGLPAAVLFEPSAEFAIRHGMHALARFDALRAYPTVLYVVKKSWAAQGEAGVRASRAIGKAHAWLWDPANKKEALDILHKYTKRDLDILQPIYDAYFVKPGSYSHDGKVRISGLQTVLENMAQDGRVFKKAPKASTFLLDPKLGGLSV